MTYTTPSSGSSTHSTISPNRSPLSNPPVYHASRTPSPSAGLRYLNPRPIPAVTPRRASTNLPRSSLSPIIPVTPSVSTTTPSTTQASTSTTSPSPPLSRSHPLLGSYPLSLLHSRMSHAHAPHSLPSTSTSGFALHLGALGKGKSCTPELRCPRHIVVPFSATYYDLEDPSGSGSGSGSRRKSLGAAQTPWVGTVDLETHYFETYSTGLDSGSPPPVYPGYSVAPLGQLQILIKTPKQAVKVFLVPYDLRNLPIGGRLLARERTYVQSPAQDGRESLRYAYQLQFVCLPATKPNEKKVRDSSTTRRRKGTSDAGSCSSSRCPTPTLSRPPLPGVSRLEGKAFYVSKCIKVVFASSQPEKHQILRTERTDEVVFPSEVAEGARGRVIGFSPGSIGKKVDDWEIVRRKWNARKEVEDIQSVQPLPSTISAYISPTKSISPTSILSPPPILSPLPLLPSRTSSSPSRPTTPIRTASPQPPSIKMPTPQRYQRQKLRRGSGSMDERELSERLRAIGLKVGAE